MAAPDNVGILLGDGRGGFSDATDFAVGLSPLSLAVGDFDGDANPDLAAANFGSDSVSVLLEQGEPTLSTVASADIVLGGQVHDTATLRRLGSHGEYHLQPLRARRPGDRDRMLVQPLGSLIPAGPCGSTPPPRPSPLRRDQRPAKVGQPPLAVIDELGGHPGSGRVAW